MCQTLFVDQCFGNDSKARAFDATRPFKTITGALNALTRANRNINVQYVIRVSPGNYDEIVNNISFVNIIGANISSTIISGFTASSTGSLENVTIRNSRLPLITVSLNNSMEEQNQVLFSNINVQALNVVNTGNSVINISGDGINNETKFELSNVDVNISQSNPANTNQVLFNIGSRVLMAGLKVRFLADYKSPASLFQNNGNLQIRDSNFTLNINEGPSQIVSMFTLGTQTSSSLRLESITASITAFIIHQPYSADVNFILTNAADIVTVDHTTLVADGVSSDFFNLVNALNTNANITILSLDTPYINMPRVNGFTNTVKYSTASGFGNQNLKGGLYTNMITVASVDFPNGYYIKENDQSIMSINTNIHLFDPTLANLQTTSKGKLISIKNIGLLPIIIDSQNNTIFDGSVSLTASQSIQFQSDGVRWFVISN